MLFEWSEQKRLENLDKHGIDFLDAKEIWQGEMFNWYRQMHLEGRGAECWPCHGCSAWLAGVRDWEYGWLRVLKKSGDHVKEAMKRDVGVEIGIYQPKT